MTTETPTPGNAPGVSGDLAELETEAALLTILAEALDPLTETACASIPDTATTSERRAVNALPLVVEAVIERSAALAARIEAVERRSRKRE